MSCAPGKPYRLSLIMSNFDTISLSERCCMSCRSCSSSNQTQFGSEIIIHHSGLKNVDKPTVMTFPKLLICLNCGFTEGFVAADALDLLRQDGQGSSARSVR